MEAPKFCGEMRSSPGNYKPVYFHYFLIKHVTFCFYTSVFENKTKLANHKMKRKRKCFDFWNFQGTRLTYELQSSEFCSKTWI